MFVNPNAIVVSYAESWGGSWGMKYPSTGEEVTDKVLTRSDPTFLGVLHYPTNNHHGLHTMK